MIPPKGADPRLLPARETKNPLPMLLLAGALTAAVFGSRVILQTIQSAPDMTAYATLNRFGTVWDSAMRKAEATGPGAVLHDATRKVEGKKF